MIPMVNLKAQYKELQEEIEQGFSTTLQNCSFIMGPQVRKFEEQTAEYLGVKHAISCASGTDALHLALLAEGIESGDEVITTAFTFIATAEAIRYVGAKPVFVDIDPETFNIDINLIEQAISPKTKAIMPVHLFGQPADLAEIKSLCTKYGLKLIEDCAQSFGASINGKMTGSFGHSSGFSFFPSKNLGAYGDGGLVVTQSDESAETITKLRNHGSGERYYHDLIGYNSRLDELQAVVLNAKLKRIDNYNQARIRSAHLYNSLLADTTIKTPVEDGIGIHVYHQYTILSEKRDQILNHLQSNKIACAIYYPVPLHKQNVFKNEYSDLSLPVTESVAASCLSLPICSSLDEDSIIHITQAIKESLA